MQVRTLFNAAFCEAAASSDESFRLVSAELRSEHESWRSKFDLLLLENSSFDILLLLLLRLVLRTCIEENDLARCNLLDTTNHG